MKLTDFLTTDRIVLDFPAQQKTDAIQSLGSLLHGVEHVADHSLFIKEVFDRESLHTTGIGNHIAIPHARTKAVNDLVVALGISKQGVEFDSLDHQPAKLIFLIGTPIEKGLEEYLKMLANLTKLLQNSDFRQTLLSANSPQEVIDAFRAENF